MRKHIFSHKACVYKTPSQKQHIISIYALSLCERVTPFFVSTVLCKSYYFKCLLHIISFLRSSASLHFPVLNFNRCLLGKHVLHCSRADSLLQSISFYNTSCYHHSTPPTQRTHTSPFQRLYTITPQLLCRHRCKYSVIQSSIRTDASWSSLHSQK